jgi:hypothetical protein
MGVAAGFTAVGGDPLMCLTTKLYVLLIHYCVDHASDYDVSKKKVERDHRQQRYGCTSHDRAKV